MMLPIVIVRSATPFIYMVNFNHASTMYIRLRHGRTYLCFRYNCRPYIILSCSGNRSAAPRYPPMTRPLCCCCCCCCCIFNCPMTSVKYECMTAARINSRPYWHSNCIIQKQLTQWQITIVYYYFTSYQAPFDQTANTIPSLYIV